MAKRKKTAPKPRPASWQVETEMEVNGRYFGRGDEVTVRDHGGRKRRVRFVEKVTAPSGAWITVMEVDKKTGKGSSTRSFDPSRIVTVHRDRRLDPRVRRAAS